MKFVQCLALLLAACACFAQSPMGVEDKFKLHVDRIVTPTAWLGAGLAAASGQLGNDPIEWGQGMAGYARRYGSSVGDTAARNMLAFGLDSALRQDPRFFRSKQTGFWPRAKDAMLQTLITRTDSGGRTFATWRFGSAYGAHLVSYSWRPDSVRTVGRVFTGGSTTLASDTVSNLFREFWPDIKKRLRLK